MKKAELEKRSEVIRATAVGLCNSIETLNEEVGLNMYGEILEYLQNKAGHS